MGLVYPCVCTRADLMASRGSTCFRRTCGLLRTLPPVGAMLWCCRRRGESTSHGAPCPGAPGSDEVSFDDLICGRQNVALSGYFGDFVLRRKEVTGPISLPWLSTMPIWASQRWCVEMICLCLQPLSVMSCHCWNCRSLWYTLISPP